VKYNFSTFLFINITSKFCLFRLNYRIIITFIYYTDRLENEHYTYLQWFMSKYLEHNITSVPYPHFVTLFSLGTIKDKYGETISFIV